MGMRGRLGLFGASVCSCLLVCPSVWAADDEETAEAAQASPADATREHILQEIEAVRQTDPELAATMEEQLTLYEAGELDLHAPELEAGQSAGPRALAAGEGSLQGGGLPSGPQLVGPPVEGDTSNMPSYMTPELREQLFNVYDQAAAGGLSEQEARTQAEGILREHGIDPREIGPGHEREFSQDALEHMSPEAREQFEQYREQGEQYREQAEQYREQAEQSREQMEHNYSAPEHEFETMSHEYEAQGHEYEAPTHESETPTHEYEAPEQPEYEAPEGAQEAPEYEAPEQPEYEAPEGGQHEYQPPQP